MNTMPKTHTPERALLTETQCKILERLFSIDAEQKCMVREIKRANEELRRVISASPKSLPTKA